jgi:hypothetical protein
MAVKVRINKEACAAKVEGAWGKGLAMLTSEIMNDCNQYCKEDTGMLIASSMIHSRPNEGQIIWQTPYARRQYWEIQTAVKDVNPKASWKWAEVAKQKHRDQWARQAQRLLEMNL